MSAGNAKAGWPLAVRRRLEAFTIDADDHLDAAWRRFDTRFGRGLPRHIAAYRGYADASRRRTVRPRARGEAAGRPARGRRLVGQPAQHLSPLRERRSAGHRAEGALPRCRSSRSRSDHEGYYTAAFDTHAAPATELWDNATRLARRRHAGDAATGAAGVRRRRLRHHLRHRRHRAAERHHRLEDRRAADLPAQRAHPQAAATAWRSSTRRCRPAPTAAAGIRSSTCRARPGTSTTCSRISWSSTPSRAARSSCATSAPTPASSSRRPGHGHKLERARDADRALPARCAGCCSATPGRPMPSCMPRPRRSSATASPRSTSATSIPTSTRPSTPAPTRTSSASPARRCRCCARATAWRSPSTPRGSGLIAHDAIAAIAAEVKRDQQPPDAGRSRGRGRHRGQGRRRRTRARAITAAGALAKLRIPTLHPAPHVLRLRHRNRAGRPSLDGRLLQLHHHPRRRLPFRQRPVRDDRAGGRRSRTARAGRCCARIRSPAPTGKSSSSSSASRCPTVR